MVISLIYQVYVKVLCDSVTSVDVLDVAAHVVSVGFATRASLTITRYRISLKILF
jgi:hypothetical protein